MLLPDFVLDWLARLRDGSIASAKEFMPFYDFLLGLSFARKRLLPLFYFLHC
jgi:hypothetical protein